MYLQDKMRGGRDGQEMEPNAGDYISSSEDSSDELDHLTTYSLLSSKWKKAAQSRNDNMRH